MKYAKKCNGTLHIKNINILNRDNNVKDWGLCSKCFNLWAKNDYDELSKRIKNNHLFLFQFKNHKNPITKAMPEICIIHAR